MLESLQDLAVLHGRMRRGFEWGFTLLFMAEYVVRILCVRRPLGYVTSSYGVVDLLAIPPTYLSLLFPAGSR